MNETQKTDKTFVIKLIAVILTTILILVASYFLLQNYSKNYPIKMSGSITQEVYEINSPTVLDFSAIGTLYIKQGEEESLVIETDETMQQYLSVNQTDRSLKIKQVNQGDFFASLFWKPDVEVNYYLTVKDLDHIIYTGVGKIKSENFTTNLLRIDYTGAGETNFYNLTAEEFFIDMSGVGDFTVSGESEFQTVNISGTGSYNGIDFKTKEMDLKLSGVGSAEVNATDFLRIDLSGIGSVKYKGTPNIEQSISGLGSVSEAR